MSDRCYSIAQIADRYSVDQHTVIHWLRSGQLRGLNVGRSPGKKRPRWRITEEALHLFEQARMTSPSPSPQPGIRRRQQKKDNIIEFY